jgi:hypothetical protein
MIADFGLSRVMEEEKLHLLTEICGTPGVSRMWLGLPISSSSPCVLLRPYSTWHQKSSRRVSFGSTTLFI